MRLHFVYRVHRNDRTGHRGQSRPLRPIVVSHRRRGGRVDKRKKALATNNAAMVLYGLSAILIGPTLPGIIAEFDLSLAEGGLVSAVQNGGGVLGSLAAVFVADRFRRPLGVVLSFLALGIVWLLIGTAGALFWVMFWFAVSGALIRLLDVWLNAHTGAMAGSNSGRPMNVLHMFFGVGALLGPIAARLIISSGTTWRGVYLSSAFLYIGAILVGTLWLRRYVSTEAAPVETVRARSDGRGEQAAAESTMQTRRAVSLLGVALFFYAIHQIGVSTWIPYFVENVLGSSPSLASGALSAYWLGIIVGRFAASRLVERSGPELLLICGSVGSAVATSLIVLPLPVSLVFVTLSVAGALSGATIPLSYTLGYRLAPARLGGLTAVLSVVMLAGRFISPWLIGVIADGYGLRIAMLLPSVGLLGVAGIILRIHRLARLSTASTAR